MFLRSRHILGFFLLLAGLGSCKMAWRALRYNKPNLDDYRLWEERAIQHPTKIHGFQDGLSVGLPPIDGWAQGRWYQKGMTPEAFFRKTGTEAFLILRRDSLLYEYYAPDQSPESRFNSFSMGKPYVATLVGIAIEEGYIASIHQAVGDFLPQFADTSLCALKISHLLQMTSGLKTKEGLLNPWATTSRLYYGGQLDRTLDRLEFEHPPGSKWKYQNLNIQLLGMVLEQATGRPISQYLEEKIWQPLGMEADAGWSLHEDGQTEKAFCCLNARARDFGRFGLLLLQNGKWEGQQIIPAEWIRQSTTIDTAEGARQTYQHTFYTSVEQEDFYLQGLLGQYTYIAPATQTVIVRIGSKINPNVPWYDMLKRIAGLKVKPRPVTLPMEKLRTFEDTWTFGLSNFSDSLMYGKQAYITAIPKGLRVKTNFQKTFTASPSTDSTFFNLEYARDLRFWMGTDSQPDSLRWSRRGNAWTLYRTEEGAESTQKED